MLCYVRKKERKLEYHCDSQLCLRKEVKIAGEFETQEKKALRNLFKCSIICQ